MEKLRCAILVEDDEDISSLLNYWIKRSKIVKHIFSFKTVGDALLFVNTHPAPCNGNWPDLVLLDLNLPDGHGLTFLKKLSEYYPPKQKPTVFIMTASEDMDDVKRASEYDVEAFIKKPLTRKKLSDALSYFKSGAIKE